MGCDLRGCADSAGVSDSLPTGKTRSHNPLVLGSNPSGPTNQPIEDAVIRETDATTREGLTGRLKLFFQLYETEMLESKDRLCSWRTPSVPPIGKVTFGAAANYCGLVDAAEVF